MKKILSILLMISMIASFSPTFVFAEETNEIKAEETTEQTAAELPENYGKSVEIGDDLYSIEEDGLYASINFGRDTLLDEGKITWLLEHESILYWSKLDKNNTDIYKMDLSTQEKSVLTKVFVPVECFDVSGDELYYLWNGEVTKLNVITNEEETVLVEENMHGFYLDEDKTMHFYNEISVSMNNDSEAKGDIINLNLLSWDDNHTVTYGGKSLPLAEYPSGSYFTKNGGSCYNTYWSANSKGRQECHDHGVCVSTTNPHCNCLRYWSNSAPNHSGTATSCSVDLQSSQCAGFARWVQWKLYGEMYNPKGGYLGSIDSSGHGSKDFSVEYPNGITEDNIKNKFTNLTLGSHIRTNAGHSMLYMDSNGEYIWTYEGNADGFCGVRVVKRKWSSMAQYIGSSVAFIVIYKGNGAPSNNTSNGGEVKETTPNVNKQQSIVNPSVNINLSTRPTTINLGNSSPIRGTITSNYPIYYVSGCILDSNGNSVIPWIDLSPGGTKKISITQSHPLNQKMKFEDIKAPGNYKIRIIVNCNNNGSQTNVKHQDFDFTVISDRQSETPSINVSSIEEGQHMSISCSDGSTVHYTINGINEQTGNGSISHDFTGAGTYNIAAWTTQSGYNQSGVAYKTIYVGKSGNPQISDPQYGDSSAWVTLSGGGTIYYTTDGSTPSKWSARYSGPIYTTNSITVKTMSAQYGSQNSDVTTKYVSVAAPDVPTGLSLYNTKQKIAQGKTATVSWNAMDRATSYEARLYYNGQQVGKAYQTKGTTAAFKLSDVGVYTIKVSAINFKGASGECGGVTVESMAPVKVTFVDKILREGKVDDSVVEQIQQNVNEHDGENAKQIEGNVLSVQKIDYDSKPSIPLWEDRTGFSRQYFTEEAYKNILEDTTVYACYSVRSYTVQFWNFWTDDSTHNGQIGITQNIMYSFSATAPNDTDTPTGYTLAGWNVDGKVSDCYDFTFVEGNMKLYTSYAWENKDLPVVLEVLSAKRGNTCQSYDISLRYINNNLLDTQARIIMSLYTSDGRMVYTATEDVDLMARDPGKYYTENIQADYADKISKVSAVMVQVKNDLTGGAVSEMVSTTDIEVPNADTYWDKWSDWSTTQPSDQPAYKDDVKGNSREIKQKTQYRYRNKRYTESSSSSMYGWNRYDTKRTSWGSTVGPVYYNPSNGSRNVWSESYVTSSNYKTIYHYYRYAYNWSGGNGSTRASDFPNYYAYDFDYELPRYTGNYGYKWQWGSGSNWNTVWRVDYIGKPYTTQQWVSDNYGTRWYYQDPVYTYYYWKWNDWSDWGDEWHAGDETETRTVYSYRDNFSCYAGYDPSRDSSLEVETKQTYEMSGNIPGLTKDYSGKLATVLAYKKTNSDPTQEQLEYVDQITLGDNNSYSFIVNPKEEISYDGTGDYIITLSIEGCEKLANIDIIKAPAPQCIVTFQNDDGSILLNSNGEELKVNLDKGSSLDVNDIPIPQKEGYRFLKWDTSLININNDITVSPIYKKETYNVVFVDYENKTSDIIEASYGDPIDLPNVEEIEGKTFDGWDAECYKYATEGNIDTEVFNVKEETPYYKTINDTYILKTEYDPEVHSIVDQTEYYKYFSEKNTTVTESKIISAKWKTNEYTVKFCDLDGNVVDGELGTQSVKYGESALLPEMVEKDGVMYSWDLTGDAWWNVTADMSVYPYVPQAEQVDAPTISAPTTDAYGIFMAELVSSDEDDKIYYTIDCGVNEKDARQFVEGQATNEESNEDQLQSIQLMSEETENIEDGSEDIDYEYVEPTAIESIEEYTAPLELYAGSIVYAFTVDKDGNISPISVFQYDSDLDEDDLGYVPNEYVPDADVPQITMPTINAKPGETITVPVTIKNNMGITNLEMILGYNTEDLTLDSVSNGNVFLDSEFTHDIREDGSSKFVWNTTSDNTKDGMLMNLTFTVKESAKDDKYLLDLNVEYSGDENEEEWYFVTVPGAITGEEVLAGTLGDVNVDGDADFADAILILKYDAGLSQLSDSQLKLGDVNLDGDVDFSDAILVIKYDAGLIPSLGK